MAQTKSSDAAAGPAHGSAHGTEHGTQHYVRIWAILLALLVVSVLGPMAEIRILTLVTAFGIAVVKAYLVCKHFMHLDVQPRFVAYFLATAVIFMLLFFFGTAPDVLHHEGQNWQNVAAQAAVERGLAGGHGHEGGEPAPFVAEVAFRGTCGPCHGPGGAGDGAAAAAMTPHPANFTDAAFWETRDRAHVVRTITEGGAAVGRSALMPSFRASFTAEQIEQLADHVLSLRPAVPDEPEPAVAGDDTGADDAGATGTDETPAEPLGAEPANGPAAERTRVADEVQRAD